MHRPEMKMIQGTALHAATMQGHLEVVKLLLSHGADPNARGGRFANALQAASIFNDAVHTEIAKLLISQGADINAQGGGFGTALEAAATTPTNRDLV